MGTRPAANALQVASGDAVGRVRLSDGSVVTLAPRSGLRIDFDGGVRRIALFVGRCRFAVAHDAAYPFVVSACDTTVTAQGTIFDVGLSGDTVSVAMFDGVVDVVRRAATDNHVTRLIKSERLVWSPQSRKVSTMTMEADDRDDAIAPYPVNTALPVSARDQSLASVVAAANATGGNPIRLEGRIGRNMVRGQFDLNDHRALALQLRTALDLDLREDDTGYILSPLR